MRARFHGGNGRLFRYVPGDDDERQVQPLLFDQRQGCEAVEIRQPVIGNDEVPPLPLERGGHGRGSLHPVAARVVAGALQCYFQQHRVVR